MDTEIPLSRQKPRVSITRQLPMTAFCTLVLLNTPYAQEQIVEYQLPATDINDWTEEEFQNTQSLNSHKDLMAADEMVRNSNSSNRQSNEIKLIASPGKTPEAMSIQEGNLLNSDDGDHFRTDALPDNWVDQLRQSFTSLVVNVLNQASFAPQTTSRLDYDTLASEEALTTVDTAYPYRTVGKLFFKTQDGASWACTAATIRPRLVSTAAQCVHNGNGTPNGYYTNFLFVPAFRNQTAPFGIWVADWVYIRPEWYNGNSSNSFDYAIFEMRDNKEGRKIGDILGYLGWGVNHLIANEGWRSTHVTVLGYPRTFGNNIHYTLDEMAQLSSGVKPFQNSAAEIVPEVYVIGSNWREGAAGSPWIKNFGWIQDEDGNRVPSNNWVVGSTSFMFTDPSININGGPEFGDDWLALKNSACARQAGNCPEGE